MKFVQNKILAIVFDYGGVIELFSDTDFISTITRIIGVTKEDWRKLYYSLNTLTNVEGREWKEVALIVAGKLGATKEQLDKISNLIDEEKRNRKLNIELLELIKKIRSLGFKTAILSNNTRILREKITKQNITDLFDAIVISSEEGYQKPDPKLFEIAFKKLGVSASNVIFIDDATPSLKSAAEIGYTPILYENNESLKNSLSKILNIDL